MPEAEALHRLLEEAAGLQARLREVQALHRELCLLKLERLEGNSEEARHGEGRTRNNEQKKEKNKKKEKKKKKMVFFLSGDWES